MSDIDTIGFPQGVVGDHLANAMGGFEPQRQNNFLISIAGLDGEDSIMLALESSALPSVGVEEVELSFLNIRRYVAGKAQYDTIPIVVKDMVDVGVATAIKRWHEQVFNPFTHKVGLAKDYKKDAEIILFAPEGSLQRSWILVGAWPLAVSYGGLDMTSSEKVLIEMTLRYDRALSRNF